MATTVTTESFASEQGDWQLARERREELLEVFSQASADERVNTATGAESSIEQNQPVSYFIWLHRHPWIAGLSASAAALMLSLIILTASLKQQANESTRSGGIESRFLFDQANILSASEKNSDGWGARMDAEIEDDFAYKANSKLEQGSVPSPSRRSLQAKTSSAPSAPASSPPTTSDAAPSESRFESFKQLSQITGLGGDASPTDSNRSFSVTAPTPPNLPTATNELAIVETKPTPAAKPTPTPTPNSSPSPSSPAPILRPQPDAAITYDLDAGVAAVIDDGLALEAPAGPETSPEPESRQAGERLAGRRGINLRSTTREESPTTEVERFDTPSLGDQLTAAGSEASTPSRSGGKSLGEGQEPDQDQAGRSNFGRDGLAYDDMITDLNAPVAAEGKPAGVSRGTVVRGSVEDLEELEVVESINGATAKGVSVDGGRNANARGMGVRYARGEDGADGETVLDEQLAKQITAEAEITKQPEATLGFALPESTDAPAEDSIPATTGSGPGTTVRFRETSEEYFAKLPKQESEPQSLLQKELSDKDARLQFGIVLDDAEKAGATASLSLPAGDPQPASQPGGEAGGFGIDLAENPETVEFEGFVDYGSEINGRGNRGRGGIALGTELDLAKQDQDGDSATDSNGNSNVTWDTPMVGVEDRKRGQGQDRSGEYQRLPGLQEGPALAGALFASDGKVVTSSEEGAAQKWSLSPGGEVSRDLTRADILDSVETTWETQTADPFGSGMRKTKPAGFRTESLGDSDLSLLAENGESASPFGGGAPAPSESDADPFGEMDETAIAQSSAQGQQQGGQQGRQQGREWAWYRGKEGAQITNAESTGGSKPAPDDAGIAVAGKDILGALEERQVHSYAEELARKSLENEAENQSGIAESNRPAVRPDSLSTLLSSYGEPSREVKSEEIASGEIVDETLEAKGRLERLTDFYGDVDEKTSEALGVDVENERVRERKAYFDYAEAKAGLEAAQLELDSLNSAVESASVEDHDFVSEIAAIRLELDSKVKTSLEEVRQLQEKHNIVDLSIINPQWAEMSDTTETGSKQLVMQSKVSKVQAEQEISELRSQLATLDGLEGEKLVEEAVALNVVDGTIFALVPEKEKLQAKVVELRRSGLSDQHADVLATKAQLNKVDELLETGVLASKSHLRAKLDIAERSLENLRGIEVVKREVEKKKAQPARDYAPVTTDETLASDNAYSTFSLHVSDVAFKLAQAALAKGEWPTPEKVRVEEFINAFDYGDPAPGAGDKVACNIEQCAHPFMQQRNLLRVAMRTAATGRSGGQPLRLTILLDHSGSMQREDREASVQRAMAVLASQLQPDDQVSLLGFARTPRLLADRIKGSEGQRLMEAVKAAPSEGGTNLEEALRLATEVAERQYQDGAVNRIVLMTDGAANLGNADPEDLAERVVKLRQSGIAFDACGVGAKGLNDQVLEALTRQGDGRYYFLDSPEQADAGFASQLAGALRPAAKNVKVQVVFNPDRVGAYRLLGFEKHRLKKEDFRNDTVDAAEMAAEEAGVALYQVEPRADGSGDIGEIRVRFLDVASGRMVEHSWTIPYEAHASDIMSAAPSMQLAATAALLGEYLRGGPGATNIDLSVLSSLTPTLRQKFGSNVRVNQLADMIRNARQAE